MTLRASVGEGYTAKMQHDNSRSVWREFFVHAFLLLIPLVILFPGVFMRAEMILPGDILYQVPPWSHHAPEGFERPSNRIMADIVTLFVPWYTLTREALTAGKWPLWNHLELTGVPLLANNQSAVLYPPHALLAVCTVPVAMTLFVLLKLWLCGMNAYICARTLGLSVPSARFASVGWMASSFVLLTCAWPLPDVAAWLPILIVGIESALANRLRRGLFGTAIGALMLILAGHIVLTFVLATGAAFYLLLRVLSEWRAGARIWPAVLCVGGGWVLAVLVSAPALLPFVEYLRHASTDYSLAAYGPEPGLAAGAVACLWAPRMFGTVAEGTFWGEIDSNQYAMLYPGLAVWFGIVFLLSAGAWEPVKRRRMLCLGLVAAVMWLIAFDAPPFRLVHLLPGFSSIKHKYHVILSLFCFPVLAGFGLERWQSQPRKLPDLRWAALLVVGAAGVVAAVYSFNQPVLRMQQLDGYVRTQALQPLLWLALTAAPIIGACFVSRPRWLPLVLTCVLLADLSWAARGMNPTLPRHSVYPETKLTSFLQAVDPHGRAGVHHGGVPSGILAGYGIEDWWGEDGMYPERIITFRKSLGDDFWNSVEPASTLR